VLTREHALVSGLGLRGISLTGLTAIGWRWSESGFAALPSVLPLVVAGACAAIGLQTALGGFMLAIIANHEARFLPMQDHTR
jgi:hypothetical protein